MEILTTNENNSERLKTSVNRKRASFLFEDNRDKYKQDLNNLEKKMDNIQDSIKAEFVNQAKNFEEIKKKKLERISSKKGKKNKRENIFLLNYFILFSYY